MQIDLPDEYQVFRKNDSLISSFPPIDENITHCT